MKRMPFIFITPVNSLDDDGRNIGQLNSEVNCLA